MSNFNEYFKNRGAKSIVDRFFNGADRFSEIKIASIKYSIVEEPPQPASYYIENKLTATHRVRIEYTTTANEDEVKLAEFEVPKEMDGLFIIEGAYRIVTNKLDSSYDCRIKMSGTGDYSINFDYNRKYDINRRILKIKKTDSELSLVDRDINVKFDDIDSLDGSDRELLKLTEEQSKKFQVKLDLDYVPEYITTRLINDCLAYGDDRLKDSIVDKTIESVPKSFEQYLFRSNNGRNYNTARRQIANYFMKFGIIQEQVNCISTLAFRFFKGSSDISSKDSNVQVPPSINAMNMESLGEKITLRDTVAYNPTFADLIDIGDTPINQNTNLQNALTVSTHVTDDGVLFDVYDKNFTRITIKYLDYLNSKVCASDYVDYNTNQLKPNENGEVEVKYRMRRKMVKVEEIDLIDLHPDYRLSSASRRIPFINSTDSVRLSMGTSMLKQSIPLVNAQRALVDTGRCEELKGNVLNERFKYDEGKVTAIDEDNITIKLKDGSEIKHPRRTAIQSINDISVYTMPKVKVGQKLKKGDVVTGAHNLTNDTFKVGLNTLVLFHAYHGLVNEDALVISESYANRMTHYSIIDLAINVKNTAAIKWIAPIGTTVKSGSGVVTLYKTNRLDEVNRALSEKLGGLFGEGNDLTEYTTEDYLKVPNNIDEAVVSDVMIQELKKPIIPNNVKKPDYSFAHTSDEVISEYEKTKDRKVIYNKYPEYIAADKLDPIVMDRNDFKVVYTVRIRLIKKTIAMVGSKITNRYGGKGVVSLVKPDEMMPIMVDNDGKQHRVEVVMNPYSTISRKIAGVLMEQELGNIAHKLYDLVEQYKGSKTNQKKIMPLITKYYPGRYDNLSVEEFINLHNTNPIEEVYYFNVGCFSEFTPERVDKWMTELGLESQSTILMPESELADMDELKDNLGEEEYNKIVKDMAGKFRPVEKKLQCGYMTLEELYHIPSYSNKVTTSLFGPDVNAKKDEPVLGRGKYRETGQSIDELSLYAYMSRNATQFISGTRKDTAKEENQTFLNNLLGLGLTISDDEGFNQGGSSLKKDLKQMKTKFRAKNNK